MVAHHLISLDQNAHQQQRLHLKVTILIIFEYFDKNVHRKNIPEVFNDCWSEIE